jgi:anti-anti-sigma factor
MSVQQTIINRGMWQQTDAIEIVGPFDTIDERIYSLAETILNEGKKDLAFNLAEVSFMTSSGVACIVKVLKKIQSLNGRLYIIGATIDMKDLLNLARLEKYLSFM